ncbi:hypothetical protein GDO78_021201 [Eleutherodactylus coqui]|uniref:Uncharacterized protein n=1 Tax=Eleutherodactylus coqui TaxID=57060 RepID=A0A8J6B426_ELECQ|nr:hypothetical protein GDO78_021201 [Eleutherodactylus coqui]
MMGIFAKCLPALPNLQKITLWNVGLMDGTFSSFMNVLQHCPSVKVISLEGNPLPDQSYHKLISDDLGLVHISLRNNQINDEGARLISQALQSLKITNKHLATLVLSYNHITDLGAGYIAQQAEAPEVSNPLLEQAEFRDGKVFLPGNKVLINLNLSQEQVSGRMFHLCADPGDYGLAGPHLQVPQVFCR